MVGLLVSGSWYHRFLAKVLELAVKSQYIGSGTFDERFLRITGKICESCTRNVVNNYCGRCRHQK